MYLGETPRENFIKGCEEKRGLPRLRQRAQSNCGEFRGGGGGFLELVKDLRTGTCRCSQGEMARSPEKSRF